MRASSPGLRRALSGLALLFLCGSPGCKATASDEGTGRPPPTRAEEVVDVLHGVEVADPYRWLEDQEAPETRAWLEAQNAHTDSVLGRISGRAERRELVRRLVDVDAISTPIERGRRLFFSRRAVGQDLAVLYVREGATGTDRVLVDPHPMSPDHSVNVGLVDVSREGTLLAYSVRQGGVDESEVRFRDVTTGRDLDDVLPADRYAGIVLVPDGSGVVYTTYGYERPGFERLTFGAGAAVPVEGLGGDYGPGDFIAPSLSDDGRWLLLHVLVGTSGPTELHLRELQSGGPFRKLFGDGRSRSFAAFAGDRLVIQTDLDAPNQRVLVADLAAPESAHWREIVPEHPDAPLESVVPVGGRLLVTRLENVRPRLSVHDLEGRELYEIAFETLGSVAGLSGSWDSPVVYYSHASYARPPVLYRHDLETRAREVWARIEVPVESEAMTVEQVFFASADGTRVPMFVVRRKDLALDGSNPTLLTGYGGFGMSLTPTFSAEAAAWVQSGGVFAVANLRGGGEYGEAWHRAGMLASKQNVFDDFIAAAEHLVAAGYTRSEHLGILGGSNGGLLVGAALTQRPDLFGAVVCTYPLLDMLRYHLFLAGAYWVPEYGSSEDPEQFAALRTYSPYHNVREGVDYPATLFITGDGDTRVAPLHVRKMAAMLQARTGGDAPILLRYHIKAGHSGGQTSEQQIDELTELLGFLEWRLGRSRR